MKTNIVLIVILSFFFIHWRCGDYDDPVSPEPRSAGFYGTVRDENGALLKDVSVYYNFTWRSLWKKSEAQRTISIAFTLTDTSHVILSFSGLGSADTIATLVNGNLPPGNHVIGYTADGLTNGIYTFILRINGAAARFDVAHQTSDFGLLFATKPLTATSSGGTFYLNYDKLGVTQGYGNTSIADSIDIILYKPGYKVLKQGFNVHGGPTIDRGFTLVK